MKKLAVFISFIALLALLTASRAENTVLAQVKFDTPIGQIGENPRVIVLDDKLYVFSRKEGRILSWTTGQDALEGYSSLPQVPVESLVMKYRDMSVDKRAEMDQIVTHILAGDGKLWALNQYSGKFGQINAEGVDYSAYTLDLSDLNPELNYDEDYRYPGFVSDGSLYLFSVMKKEMFFARYDLATGERQDIALPGRGGTAYPYHSGYALYAVNTQTERGSGGYAESLYTLDLATGVLVPMENHLPQGTMNNTTTYIKDVCFINQSNSLFYYLESGGGASSDTRILVFDQSGSLRINAALAVPENGFYYLCQPIDAQRVMAVDAFGAVVLDVNKLSEMN